MQIGCFSPCEELGPDELIEQARAEQAGFHALWISDHFHPWNDDLAQVLPTPAHFEQASQLVTAEHLASPMGPDLDEHAE